MIENKINSIKNYISKISCIYVPIKNNNNIDIIYDLYINNIEPDFNNNYYDSIVYLYYSLYLRNVKKNYNKANEILFRAIEINDDNIKWCYNELGYHTNNVKLIKKGFKHNNIFSLILLMFLHHTKISPKYYIKFYEYRHDMMDFCKREKLLTYGFGLERYDKMTPEILYSDFYTEYIKTFNEYNELLLKFNNDDLFPI
jgi:tetratricopeptide (TPR) repeat protein